MVTTWDLLGTLWGQLRYYLGTVGAFLWNLEKTLGLLWHYWRSGSVQLPCRQHMLISFRFTALTWLRIGVVYEALHSFKEGLVLSWGYMAHHLSALQLTQHFRDYISSLSLIFSALVISFFSPYICKNFFQIGNQDSRYPLGFGNLYQRFYRLKSKKCENMLVYQWQ